MLDAFMRLLRSKSAPDEATDAGETGTDVEGLAMPASSERSGTDPLDALYEPVRRALFDLGHLTA